MTNTNKEQIVAVLTTACVGLAGLAGSYLMYEILTAPLPVTAQGSDETAARGEVVGKCELLGICQEPKDSESGRRGN